MVWMASGSQPNLPHQDTITKTVANRNPEIDQVITEIVAFRAFHLSEFPIDLVYFHQHISGHVPNQILLDTPIRSIPPTEIITYLIYLEDPVASRISRETGVTNLISMLPSFSPS